MKGEFQNRAIEENLPFPIKYCDSLETLKKHKININNAQIYCETEGKGKTNLLLVPGGPGATHYYFHPFFSNISKYSKVIYFDPRGCGNSSYSGTKYYTIEQHINDIEELRVKLELDNLVILGHSFGGLIAQLYALKYQQHLKGLILVSSTPGFPTGPHRKNSTVTEEEKRILSGIKTNHTLSERVKDYNLYINGAWKNYYYKMPWKQRLLHRDYEWGNDISYPEAMEKSTENINLKGAFVNFSLPTLIIEGLHDLIFSRKKCNLFIKNHPNARYFIFENSGHNPFEDESELFNETLFSFLKQFFT